MELVAAAPRRPPGAAQRHAGNGAAAVFLDRAAGAAVFGGVQSAHGPRPVAGIPPHADGGTARHGRCELADLRAAAVARSADPARFLAAARRAAAGPDSDAPSGRFAGAVAGGGPAVRFRRREKDPRRLDRALDAALRHRADQKRRLAGPSPPHRRAAGDPRRFRALRLAIFRQEARLADGQPFYLRRGRRGGSRTNGERPFTAPASLRPVRARPHRRGRSAARGRCAAARCCGRKT